MLSRLVNSGITNFVMANWEELAPRMREAGIKLSDDMPEAYRAWREVEEVEDAYAAEKGYVIILRGNDYVVTMGDETVVKSSEQLPDIVRRNLGLLKLSVAGETIPNIGIRMNDYTFFVMDGTYND
jgi:hypothetical protein